jgi:hypothetical protein
MVSMAVLEQTANNFLNYLFSLKTIFGWRLVNPSHCFETWDRNVLLGHDHLLEIRLLEKSARHDFLFARHHLSKCHFFCQLLENQKSWKIICRTCISSSFTFRQKNINCSNCNWSTKVLENVNCSTQFIVKKMVYIYGS